MTQRLRSAVGGREQTFEGDRVTIGSGQHDDIKICGPEIQSAHIVVTYGEGGWKAQRTGPPRTMFVGGRSKASVPITAATLLRLGTPQGPEVVLQPVDAHEPLPPYVEVLVKQQQRTSDRLRMQTVALVAFVVLGILAGLNAGRLGDYLRDRELGDVESATVRLVARNSEGGIQTLGSGTIVDSSGLVLTNAHVAAPSAPGLQLRYGTDFPSPDPKRLEVWMVKKGEDFATPAYRGRLVIADGWLDLAVVRIDGDKDGKPLPAGQQFPSVSIGRRGGMERADVVYVVGYPAISGGEAQRISSGSVSAWHDEQRITGRRDVLETTADITGGNSGGAVVDGQGKLIAVAMARHSDSEAPVSAGQARPVEFAQPLLQAARRSDAPTYRTPFLLAPTGTETARLLGWAELQTDGTCGPESEQPPARATALCVRFELGRMEPGLDVFFGLDGSVSALGQVSEKGGNMTFRVHLPSQVSGPMSWRLDVGGGVRVLNGSTKTPSF